MAVYYAFVYLFEGGGMVLQDAGVCGVTSPRCCQVGGRGLRHRHRVRGRRGARHRRGHLVRRLRGRAPQPTSLLAVQVLGFGVEGLRGSHRHVRVPTGVHFLQML
ncbi:hypothetical protein B566_EDAN005217 [Ephemera danica]|nr:hypothetical protein B566_EDAN005217 [Ephemera danica]